MEDQPRSKGIEPVPGIALINFMYWLRTYHYPKLQQLESLEIAELLELIHQFESYRPDLEPYQEQSWAKSLDQLLSDSPGYEKAHETFEKLK